MSDVRRSARLAVAVLFAASVLAVIAGQDPVAAQSSGAGGGGAAGAPGRGRQIPDQYIVTFKSNTPAVAALARHLTDEGGGTLLYTYEHALNGFTATMTAARAEALSHNPNVASVEPDAVATVSDVQSPATWGLDRIDQRDLPLDNSYDDRNEGAGVNIYIIDTGVRASHSEFAGRVGNGYDAITSGGTANDCNGHGTHVSSTAAGSTYGVADKAVLHPVRVLDCNGSGSNSAVIAGVDWVRANAVKPAVANMSLGGGVSTALDNAVNNLISSGVVLSVAAGNDNTTACNGSPSRVAAAITVGATTSTDARSSFSNWGTCLDLFAPGSSITGAWYTSDTATNTISGTSMATPHVTGAAALYLSANPTASAATVRNALVSNGTTGKVTSPGTGSPNVLLYTGFIGGGSPPPPTSSTTTTTTIAPPPPPSSLVNPGFEGATGWTQSSSGGYTVISTSRPRTGSYSAWLGGYNNAVDSVRQTVTVPTNGTLRYWWYLTSSEGTTTAYDYLYVRVLRPDGSVLTSLARVSNRNQRGAWVQDTVSLSAYAGQSVQVQFYATTDSSLTSSFYVDDASLTNG